MSSFALLLAVAAILLLAMASVQSRALRSSLAVAGAFLPLALAWVAVDRGSANFGDVRLAIRGVQMAANGEATITIGGDSGADDIIVPRLAPTIARLTNPQSLDVFFRTPAASADQIEPPVALVSFRRGAALRDNFVGSFALTTADRFCLSACTTARSVWYRLNDGGTALMRSDQPGETLPELMGRRFPYRPYHPAQAIYPLRDYGRSFSGQHRPFDPPCAQRLVCDTQTRMPVNSFIYHNKEATWQIMLLDPGAVLERVGPNGQRQRLRAPTKGSAPLLRDGRAMSRVDIWQISYADSDRDFRGEPTASRLMRRKTLTLTGANSGRLTLGFEREPMIAIHAADVRDIQQRLGVSSASTDSGPARGSPVVMQIEGALLPDQAERPGNSLRFADIGGRLASGLSAASGLPPTLTFPADFYQPDHARDLPSAARVEPTDNSRGRQNFLSNSGGNEGEGAANRLLLSMDRYSYPIELLWIIGAWAVIMAGWMATGLRNRPIVQSLMIGVQLLLVMRLLVVIGASGHDPQIDMASALFDGYAAYVLVPLTLFALFRQTKAIVAEFAAPIFLIGMVFWRTAPGLPLFWSGVAAAIIALVVLKSLPSKIPQATAPDGGAWRARFWSQLNEVRASSETLLAAPTLKLLCLAGFALLLFRLAFFVAGSTERAGVALSTLYLPPALLISVGLFAHWREVVRINLRSIPGWWAVAIFGAIWAAPAVINDSGFVLVLIVPTLSVLALVERDRLERLGPALPRWKKWGWLGAVCIGASAAWTVPMAATAYQNLTAMDAADVAATRSPETVIEHLANDLESSGNDWRLQAIFNPNALNEAGLGDGEKLRRWRFTIDGLTGDSTGHGMPYRADISEIRPFQANDNLSAVQIMAPYGRWAGALLITLLGTMVVSATMLAGGFRAQRSVRQLWGLSALLCFAASGIYMILANLMLLLFTGRNVYFLAALSKSDLLEGLILIVIAAYGLHEAPGIEDGVGQARQEPDDDSQPTMGTSQ